PIEDLLEGHAQFVFLKGSVFGKMTLKRLLNQDIFENLATKINDEIHAFLNIFFKPLPFVHIKGIRGAQQRFYNSNGTSDLDKSINLLLTLQNQKDKEKLDFIHEWLPKFGINGIIEAQQIDGSYITATIDGRYIADLGLGISQLLPIIITTAYHLGDGYLIAIEEPESHLHPKLQSVLADFMVAAIGKGARFLVETHSVYFIRKIEVLLANKQLSSDNLRVCYIKKNEDIGASTPEVIDIEANEDGLNEQQTSGLWRDFYDEAERLTQEKKIIKHIKEGMKVFFVEKNDVKHYNKLKLSNIFFYEANDKNDVFRISKQDNVSFYGLMDRDLLHDDEIEKIREEFPRLFILPFYNIESLLFHPENLKEALGDSFDICQYKDEILKQFTEYRVKGITRNIDASRGSYLILKEHIIYKNDTKKVKKIADKICEEIFKDDFASFYKYYNLRDNFNKGFIEKKLPKRDDLSSTQWFKKQIEEVLSPLLSQTKDESDTIG
ncbi:MAG TPA: AAA family ATPase, partial [Chitinophagales bacterium]|nr:AAA family ATPase [Chitinophagales bacterium]